MGGVVQSVENAGQGLINSVSNVGVGIDKLAGQYPGGWTGIAGTAAAIAAMNPSLMSFGSATTSTSALIGADATGLAAQGIPASQISDILAQSYGIDQYAATNAASIATAGGTASDIASTLAADYGTNFTGLPDAAKVAAGGLGATGNTLATLAAVKALGGGTPTTTGGIQTPTAANPTLNITAPATTTTAGISQLALPNFPQVNPIANPTLAQVTPTNIPNAMNSAAPVAMPVSDQYINQYLANQQIQSEFPQMGRPLGTAKVAAEGGIMQSYAVGGPIMQASNLGSVGGNPMYPQANYNTNTTLNNPNNMPLSTNMIGGTNAPSSNPINMPVATNMLGGVGDSAVDPYTGEMRLAAGGGIAMAGGGASNLGSYSDGGRLLKGPGDGMSDNIPASIANKQPARLADGEFVVPADVVSHLGNGSTDAGAKQLYAMMDRIRKARTGRKAQGKQIKAQKYLPK